MTTQHQAPEVTSRAREAAIEAFYSKNDWEPDGIRSIREIIASGDADSQPFVQAFARFEAVTRATQPLSLTVDEGLAEQVARIIDPYIVALTDARAALDRLQSLSLPVDIDRSGLAQEVE